MRLYACAVIAALSVATPSFATEDSGEEAGRSLMEKGMAMFLEGLQRAIEPALRDLQALADEAGPILFDFLEEMGPAMAEIAQQVQDWSQYHPPEILPNGDIIIRRKTPDEIEQEIQDDAEGTDI